jgi:hypothetical protein
MCGSLTLATELVSGDFPFAVVLGLSFRPFLSLAFGRALTHGLLDGVVFGDNRSRLLAGDRGSIHIAQLVRFVLVNGQ